MTEKQKVKLLDRLIPLLIIGFLFCGLCYLGLQANRAYSEYRHWKTRENVLVKELEDLREEAKQHQTFLDRLRRNPDFQDEVARKELGYGYKDEWLYRFPPTNSKKE